MYLKYYYTANILAAAARAVVDSEFNRKNPSLYVYLSINYGVA